MDITDRLRDGPYYSGAREAMTAGAAEIERLRRIEKAACDMLAAKSLGPAERVSAWGALARALMPEPHSGAES